MAKFELVMPKLGESVIEATITRWMKNEGDTVQEDDAIVEIATDKVDSEIPSPVEGILSKLLYQEGDVVAVGAVIAIIATESEAIADATESASPKEEAITTPPATEATPSAVNIPSDRFYSPLVRSMARAENISPAQLEQIPGTGQGGRVTRRDMENFISNKPSTQDTVAMPQAIQSATPPATNAPTITAQPSDNIIEMDRMRKLIADHMVMSKQVSPHVTMFHEVDVTNIVQWRNRVKDGFAQREGVKLTFMPLFIDVAARALKEFPRVNASLNGYQIIERKAINIGMATALPNGNLIVPVIRHADQKNLLGLAHQVNDLADRARSNKLIPDEIQGGTFTITNFGSFGSITGSPIINQPQVAILGIGTIKKRPVVIEQPEGDVIAIRHIMVLSMAFDHRIVDGAMGGMFLKKMADMLESFDPSQTI